MDDKEVFLGLGGNVGDVASNFCKALDFLAATPQIKNIQLSRVYRTSPVSDIPQMPYLNAVCRLTTSFTAYELLKHLQAIQMQMGQTPKSKNAPRMIDLDILFFGNEAHSSPDLEIPHPRWKERLFVLTPLLDLIQMVKIPGEEGPIDLNEIVKNFHNKHNELILLHKG